MTSRIDFYRTALTPEKNAWIEDIDDFIITFGEEIYTEKNFQYQKISLNMDVVVATNQSSVGDGKLGNYCRIQQEGRSYYFFVVGTEWVSTKAVRVKLSMDTINTYGKDLVFSPKTTIQREHQDRFGLVYGQTPGQGIKRIYRKIDRQVEGIDLPKEKQQQSAIQAKEGNLDWYLIYKTRDNLTPENNANPIECDLIAEKSLLIKDGREDVPPVSFLPASMPNDEFWYFDPDNNPDGGFTTIENITSSRQNIRTEPNVIWAIYKNSNSLFELRKLTYKDNRGEKELTDNVKYGTAYKEIIFQQCNGFPFTKGFTTGWKDITTAEKKPIVAGSQEKVQTIAFEELDKTDSKLMKIIRLPYAPISISKNQRGEYVFPADWTFRNGMMRLASNNLSREFKNTITELNITGDLSISVDINLTTPRNEHYESKLYNSEFRTYKCVYDSFAHEIPFENFTVTPSYGGESIIIPVEFKPTNTVNSKFAFKFDANWNDEVAYTTKSDYENYMIVDRNNEETIFSNDYINYIRNGYNYDKKQKWINFGTGLFSNALGFGQFMVSNKAGRGKSAQNIFDYLGGLEDIGLDETQTRGVAGKLAGRTANSAFLSAAAINAGFSAATGLAGSITNLVQSYQAEQQKLNELAQQSTQVQGSDDVDLLKYYNKNRLERVIYELEPLAKKNIYDLLFYTGYNHPVQELPALNTRYWFNYVQCSPVFKNEAMSVYSNYLLDIRARFEQGITIFHHHPGVGTEWDMEQEYENWETSLLA